MPKFMYRNNCPLGDNSKTLTPHLLVVYISSSMGSNSLEASNLRVRLCPSKEAV